VNAIEERMSGSSSKSIYPGYALKMKHLSSLPVKEIVYRARTSGATSPGGKSV
jgi:hypothetical protein